jgi:general stress protein 26
VPEPPAAPPQPEPPPAPVNDPLPSDAPAPVDEPPTRRPPARIDKGAPMSDYLGHPQQALWDLIHDIRHAMLTTTRGDGRLRSRPMTTQNGRLDEDDTLYFFASLAGDVADDLRRESQVNVTYADPDGKRYVSVTGRARFIDNELKKISLWSPAALAWFPQGPDDPDLGLLEVRIDRAEYWDLKSSKMVQLLRIAKAAVTGQPRAQVGEHREVSFH